MDDSSFVPISDIDLLHHHVSAGVSGAETHSSEKLKFLQKADKTSAGQQNSSADTSVLLALPANPFASLSNPEGNGWLLQEVTARLPGHVDADGITFSSSIELAAALRCVEAAHGEREKRTGRRQGMIEWPHVRHEEVAAFAAGAEAHLSGELAVYAGSCGPGNLHLINGLFDCHRSPDYERRRRWPVSHFLPQESESRRNYSN